MKDKLIGLSDGEAWDLLARSGWRLVEYAPLSYVETWEWVGGDGSLLYRRRNHDTVPNTMATEGGE